MNTPSTATTLATGTKLSTMLEAVLVSVPGLREGRGELEELSASLRREYDVPLDSVGLEAGFCDMIAAGFFRLQKSWSQERAVVAKNIRDALLTCADLDNPSTTRNLVQIPEEAVAEMYPDGVEVDDSPPVPSETLTYYSWGDVVSEAEIQELGRRIEQVDSREGLAFTDQDGLEAFFRWKQRQSKPSASRTAPLPADWEAKARVILASTAQNLKGFARRDLLEQLRARRQEAIRVHQWHLLTQAAAALRMVPSRQQANDIVFWEKSAMTLIERGLVFLSALRGETVIPGASSEVVQSHFRPRRTKKMNGE